MDRSNGHAKSFIPFIGSGTGGSSALYGGVLERFHELDFAPRQQAVDAGSTLPDGWPIDYATLRPYYGAAERLYRVAGELDPLRADSLDPLPSPRPPAPLAGRLIEELSGRGLHPYRLPVAGAAAVGDDHGGVDDHDCQGFLCERGCGSSAASRCLEPALRRHDAALLCGCEVTRLKASRRRVTGVVCRVAGIERELHADTVIVAAGALATPCLLLRSTSSEWPDGLANRSGLVGRNLMRHYVDLYALDPERIDAGAPRPQNHKDLGFNDLYGDGSGFGTVQSFGRLPPAAVVVAGLEKEVRDGRWPWLAPLLRGARPLLRGYCERLRSRSLLLAGIAEDLPYVENQIRPGSDGQAMVIQYRISSAEQARIARWRARLGGLLAPYRPRLLKQAESNERIAHACGTCRFGDDPAQSVLDRNNRAHGLDNLYVVDASFFPSSGGTNPALTIAANALRVAEGLVGGEIGAQA